MLQLSNMHNVCCVLLALSKEILSCGLEDLILSSLYERQRTSRVSISSFELYQLLSRTLANRMNEILSSYEELAKKYDCHDDYVEFLKRTITGSYEESNSSTSLAHTNACSIRYGEKGRMLETNRGVGKGTILTSEIPYLASIKSKCNCECCNIYVEHIGMAWRCALDMSKFIDGIEEAGKLKMSSESLLLTNVRSLDYILTVACSGLCKTNVLDSDSDNIKENIFPLRTQLMLCIIPIISSFISFRCHSDNTSCKYFGFLMYNILARLPLNCHAISQVVENNLIIRQERIGIALFPVSSSINHSCRPNATVKFEFDSEVSDDVPLHLLQRTRLCITAIQSISRNSEITISYGILAGKHSFLDRQSILFKTYLFHCRCSSCCEEITSNECTTIPSNVPSVEETLKSQWRLTVYERIRQFRQDVEILNGEFSCSIAEISNSSHSPSNRIEGWAVLEKQKLFPCILVGIELLLLSFNLEAWLHNMLIHFLSQSVFESGWNTIGYPCLCRLLGYLFPSDAILTSAIKASSPAQGTASLLGLDPSITAYRFSQDCPEFSEMITLLSTVVDMRAFSCAQILQHERSFSLVSFSIVILLTAGVYECEDIAIARELVKLGEIGTFLVPKWSVSSHVGPSPCDLISRMLVKCQSIFNRTIGTSDPDFQRLQGMILYFHNNVKSSSKWPVISTKARSEKRVK